MDSGDDFTRVLRDAAAGDEHAREKIVEIAYERLRALAGVHLRSERANHTLQPTELVSEAWLKLSHRDAPVTDRTHFLRLAARVMRQILIDHERRRRTQKRGGDHHRIEMPVDLEDPTSGEKTLDLLYVNELLDQLEKIHEVRARIVELRLFGGIDTASIAESINLSRTATQVHLQSATAWLEAHLNRADTQ